MTGDEPQGTMGKVQTVGKVVSFPPSFARTFSSRERRLGTRQVQARLGNWFDSDFFFRAACVTTCNKKIVSHVSPGLKFTISLKIIEKNYFQLNCTRKFWVE